MVVLLGWMALVWTPTTDAAVSADFTQGVTKESIKIAMFSPFSGTGALYGKLAHGVQAIYMEQNKKGGINGRNLELVVEDDAGNPANAPVVFRKLAEQEKVFMIHGGAASPVPIAMKRLIQESGIPFLIITAAANAVTDPPIRNMFSPHPCAADMSRTVAQFGKSINPKRIAVITQKDEWGKGWRDPFIAAMKQWGIEVVADAEIASEIGDATSLVRIAMRQRADVVALFSYPQPTSVFLRDAYAQGLNVPVITGSGAMPEDVLRRVGQREPVLQFFSTYLQKYQVDSPEYVPYRKMMAEYFPKDVWDGQVMSGMTGAYANIEVLKRIGNNLTWENWIKTMESLKDFDTDVLVGSVTYRPFDPADPATRRGVTGANMTVLNPDPKGSPIILVKDWADFQKRVK